LCHDSPNEKIASGQKFADLSLLVNGRFPSMWQMEFTDHVTWCSTQTRTSPAQKNAVTAPQSDQVARPPISAGTAKPRCACQNPFAMAHGVVPNSHGECGSPSRSAKAWCRRWSATRVVTGPCSAVLPAIASVARDHGLALNEPWVKCRW
jgi:hypothetical protein